MVFISFLLPCIGRIGHEVQKIHIAEYEDMFYQAVVSVSVYKQIGDVPYLDGDHSTENKSKDYIRIYESSFHIMDKWAVSSDNLNENKVVDKFYIFDLFFFPLRFKKIF